MIAAQGGPTFLLMVKVTTKQLYYNCPCIIIYHCQKVIKLCIFSIIIVGCAYYAGGPDHIYYSCINGKYCLECYASIRLYNISCHLAG